MRDREGPDERVRLAGGACDQHERLDVAQVKPRDFAERQSSIAAEDERSRSCPGELRVAVAKEDRASRRRKRSDHDLRIGFTVARCGAIEIDDAWRRVKHEVKPPKSRSNTRRALPEGTVEDKEVGATLRTLYCVQGPRQGVQVADGRSRADRYRADARCHDRQKARESRNVESCFGNVGQCGSDGKSQSP
jgi:hypothetical protein